MTKPQFTFTDGLFVGFLLFCAFLILVLSTLSAEGLVAYLEIVNPDLLERWQHFVEMIRP